MWIKYGVWFETSLKQVSVSVISIWANISFWLLPQKVLPTLSSIDYRIKWIHFCTCKLLIFSPATRITSIQWLTDSDGTLLPSAPLSEGQHSTRQAGDPWPVTTGYGRVTTIWELLLRIVAHLHGKKWGQRESTLIILRFQKSPRFALIFTELIAAWVCFYIRLKLAPPTQTKWV